MNSFTINDKWQQGTLTCEDVEMYLRSNVLTMSTYPITDQDCSHVADICFSVYKRHMKREVVGDLLSAIQKNDWREVNNRADDCIRQWQWVIHIFLYNCAPVQWREQV